MEWTPRGAGHRAAQALASPREENRVVAPPDKPQDDEPHDPNDPRDQQEDDEEGTVTKRRAHEEEDAVIRALEPSVEEARILVKKWERPAMSFAVKAVSLGERGRGVCVVVSNSQPQLTSIPLSPPDFLASLDALRAAGGPATDPPDPLALFFRREFCLGVAASLPDYLMFNLGTDDDDVVQAVRDLGRGGGEDPGMQGDGHDGGVKLCTLEVYWTPLAGPAAPQSQTEEDAQEVEEINAEEEQLGKAWCYELHVPGARDMPIFAKARLIYDFFGERFSSDATEGFSYDPFFDYRRVHHVPVVTQAFLDFIKSGIRIFVHATQYVDAAPHSAFIGPDERRPPDGTGSRVCYLAERGNTVALRALVHEWRHKDVLSWSNYDEGFHGRTPLMVACLAGHLEAARMLAANAPSINKGDDAGESALILATASHSVAAPELVAILLSAPEISINKVSDDGMTALVSACKHGKTDVVRTLAGSPDLDASIKTNNNESCLHFAARCGDPDMMHVLLSLNGIAGLLAQKASGGAFASPWPKAPLYLAVEYDQREAAELLRAVGAVLTAEEEQAATCEAGGRACWLAARDGNMAALGALAKKWEGNAAALCWADYEGRWNPLLLATQEGHVDAVSLLAGTAGVDVNQANMDGWTPLMAAVCFGETPANFDMVRILLAAPHISVDVKATGGDWAKHSALDVSKKKGKIEISALLRSSGAQLSSDEAGERIQEAAEENDLETLRLLLREWKRYALVVNWGDGDGVTALYSASKEGHIEACRILVANGVSINLGKNDGTTPLQVAVQKDRAEIVKFLLSCKTIEPSKENNYGETALGFAKRGNVDRKIVDMLTKAVGVPSKKAVKNKVFFGLTLT